MTYIKRFLLICCTSYSLMFFSEYFFMNEGPAFALVDTFNQQPIAIVWMLLELILWYLLPTYLFLSAVSYFRAQHIWALLLAGALYGFAVEGIIVWQLYEALPFSISWTALGWHMLVDVWLGWYLVQYLLASKATGRLAVYCIGLGLFWGVWATWYGIEQPLLSPTDFTVLAIIMGGGWVIANGISRQLWNQPFQSSRRELYTILVVSMLFFAIQILTVFFWTIFILPPLLLVTFFALHRHQQLQSQTILTALESQMPWYYSLVLMLTPLTAILVYPYIYTQPEITVIVADLLPFSFMVLGGVVYSIALWKTAVNTQQTSMPPSPTPKTARSNTNTTQ